MMDVEYNVIVIKFTITGYFESFYTVTLIIKYTRSVDQFHFFPYFWIRTNSITCFQYLYTCIVNYIYVYYIICICTFISTIGFNPNNEANVKYAGFGRSHDLDERENKIQTLRVI